MEPTPAPPADAAFPVIPTPAIPAATALNPAWCRRCHSPNAPNSRFCATCGAGIGGETGAAPVEAGAEAWISIALGALLLFLAPRLIQYIASPSTFTWTFTEESGAPLPNMKSVYFWGDVALASFAVVLILDGLVVMLGRRPRLVLAAFVLTVITTILNVFFVGMMMSKGYGFQLMAAIAIIFGGYIAAYQYRLWKSLTVPVL
jgi:hypothetical protein